MSLQNVLAGIAVNDLDAAVDWYQKLLGRAPDLRPMPTDAEWNFPRGGALQVFHDTGRAGATSITLAVDDLDDELTRLGELGLKTSPINDASSVRTAIVRDPDGNQIVLAQALDATVAQ